jgi:hypothetical protein
MSEETEACAARWSAEYAGLTGWPEFTLSSTEGSRCPVVTPSQPLVYRAFSAEEPLASATMLLPAYLSGYGSMINGNAHSLRPIGIGRPALRSIKRSVWGG